MHKVAILSDIHANRLALEAVWTDLRDDIPDEFWFLGDLIGRGDSPGQALTMLARRFNPAVWLAGNHDLAALGDEALYRAITRQEDRSSLDRHFRHIKSHEQFNRFSQAIPQQRYTLGDIEFLLAHGWPQNNGNLSLAAIEYDTDKAPLGSKQNHNKIFDIHAQLGANVWIVGHSHYQTGWVWNTDRGVWAELIPGFGQKLDGRHRINTHEGEVARGSLDREDLSNFLVILNPGSVGLPRDGGKNELAKYMVLEIDNQNIQVIFHSVRYIE